MDPDREASDMVDTISHLPLPTLSDILNPYDPDIKNVPPRPPNTYLLFRVWMSKLGDRQTVISHLIWREVKIRSTTRNTVVPHFEELANEAKEVHRLAYPEYKYRPVKRGAEGYPEAPRPRVPKKKKHKTKEVETSVGEGAGVGGGVSERQRGSDIGRATAPVHQPHGHFRRHFEIRQPLAVRTQSYQAMAPTASSSASTSACVSHERGGRNFPSRYLPEPVPSSRGYGYHSASARGSYSHYSNSGSHSLSISSSYSSNQYFSSSSSSSSSSPSHSPLRSPSTPSSSSDDLDDAFKNFRYQPERRREPHQVPEHDYLPHHDHRHPRMDDVDAAVAEVRVDGSNGDGQGDQILRQQNANVRRAPTSDHQRTRTGTSTTAYMPQPPLNPAAQHQRSDRSDYDSGSDVEEE